MPLALLPSSAARQSDAGGSARWCKAADRDRATPRTLRGPRRRNARWRGRKERAVALDVREVERAGRGQPAENASRMVTPATPHGHPARPSEPAPSPATAIDRRQYGARGGAGGSRARGRRPPPGSATTTSTLCPHPGWPRPARCSANRCYCGTGELEGTLGGPRNHTVVQQLAAERQAGRSRRGGGQITAVRCTERQQCGASRCPQRG